MGSVIFINSLTSDRCHFSSSPRQVLLVQRALLLFRQVAIRRLIQGARANDLKWTIFVVTPLIRCPAATVFVAFVWRAPAASAIAEHLDDDDRRAFVVVGLRRQPGLLSGGGRVGGPRRLTMYLATLYCATSNPSLSSSPWMRGAPQSGFSMLIRRINARSSVSICGRPPSGRDFQRQ